MVRYLSCGCGPMLNEEAPVAGAPSRGTPGHAAHRSTIRRRNPRSSARGRVRASADAVSLRARRRPAANTRTAAARGRRRRRDVEDRPAR